MLNSGLAAVRQRRRAEVRRHVRNGPPGFLAVDGDRVGHRGEAAEVVGADRLFLVGVAEVGVMGHHGHDAAALIKDRAHMRRRAVDAAF